MNLKKKRIKWCKRNLKEKCRLKNKISLREGRGGVQRFGIPSNVNCKIYTDYNEHIFCTST